MYEEFKGEYRNLFIDKKQVEIEFKLENGSLDNLNIIFAHYEYENYSGNSYVLFAKGSQLFEVRVIHGSCCWLDGLWHPEPVTLEFLERRIADRSYFHLGFSTHEYTKLCEDIKHVQERKTH